MFLDLLVYTKDIDLLHKNLNTENKSTTSLDTSKEDGSRPNSEQTKYTMTPITEVQDKTFYKHSKFSQNFKQRKNIWEQ
jgi:hypothetical protein